MVFVEFVVRDLYILVIKFNVGFRYFKYVVLLDWFLENLWILKSNEGENVNLIEINLF